MSKMNLKAARRIYRATTLRHGYIPKGSFASRAMRTAMKNQISK